jgi:hypothetical protein
MELGLLERTTRIIHHTDDTNPYRHTEQVKEKGVLWKEIELLLWLLCHLVVAVVGDEEEEWLCETHFHSHYCHHRRLFHLLLFVQYHSIEILNNFHHRLLACTS